MPRGNKTARAAADPSAPYFLGTQPCRRDHWPNLRYNDERMKCVQCETSMGEEKAEALARRVGLDPGHKFASMLKP